MSSPHKTLVFHIGDRKTRSTSIQATFARNMVTLKDRTIFYPDQADQTAQSLDPPAWLEPDELRSLTVLATLIGDMTRADPDRWVALWRANLVGGLQSQAATDH